MCGIAGLVDHGERFEPEQRARLARAMADRLRHRGPDDAGVWVDPTGICALAHARLSIIDLGPGGHQPMLRHGGDIALTFNGELYNYRELREELRGQGEVFETESDTEVLVRILAEREEDGLDELQGMYAIAQWNATRRSLFLARDPFGKKPLYVARGEGWLAFASELDALRVIPHFEPRVDRQALAEYLLLQYIPAPHTIYEGVSKLEPGTWERFTVDGSGLRHERGRHFQLELQSEAKENGASTPPMAERVEELRPVLITAVEQRLRSDVPLGVFLSGGIDSALVTAIMRQELGVPVDSFSIGFEGFPGSEHVAARQAADTLGTTHHEKLLAPNAIEMMPEIAALLDEPLGDSSCLPTFLLSEFTRERVTVALSGDGGDELFGGYGRYQDTAKEAEGARRRWYQWWKSDADYSPGQAYCGPRWLMFPPDQLRSLAGEEMTDGIQGRVSAWIDELDDETWPLVHRMRRLDARTYLPGAVLTKVDRMSMAVSLEVRSPLLDKRVAEVASRLRGPECLHQGRTKPVLRELARRYLSEEYIERPKIGFGLPDGAWTHGDILNLADRSLLGDDGRSQLHLGREGIEWFLERSRHPGGFSVYQMWTLLMLEFWLRVQDGETVRDLRPVRS